MFRLLKAIDNLKGERCPGEDRCTILHPGLEEAEEIEAERARLEAEGVEVVEVEESIFTPSLDLDPQATCPGCYLFATKPGREPLAIQAALYWATEHDRKRRTGYTPRHKDELTALQWAAWHGLDGGRARWEEVVTKRMRDEAEQRRAQAGRQGR